MSTKRKRTQHTRLPGVGLVIRNLPPLDAQQRYTILEAAAYLRVSRAYIFRLIADRKIRAIKDGSRTYVPGTEIARRSKLPARAA